MIRILAILLALALPAAAQTTLRLDDRFDAGRLDAVEKRYLQAALAFEGTYNALLDGAWGRGSQGALERWAGGTPRWRDLRPLLTAFEAERGSAGWTQVVHEEEGVGHLLPRTLLERREGGRELRYVSPDGGLVLLFQIDASLPIALHDAFREDVRDGTDAYRVRNEALTVTAGQMRGGRHVYARSDRFGRGGRWATHIVLADEANRGRLRLIAASFADGARPQLDLPARGILATLIRAEDRVLPRRQPDPNPRDPLESALELLLDRALDRAFGEDDAPAQGGAATAPRDRRTASGFHVNTTDVVTVDALIARCGSIETRGGAPVDVIHRDRDLGLAVVAVPGRSAAWLSVSPDAPVANGRIAMIRARADRREGRITYVDGRNTMVHSVAVGRAGLGAPFVSQGRVVGVARPQGEGQSYRAVQGSAVSRMLSRAGIVHQARGGTDSPSDAVVRLRCAE